MNELSIVDNLGHMNMFSEGIYARTVFMSSGSFIVGKKHKTRHLNIVLTGSATVWLNGEKNEIKAPYIFESQENVRKVLIIHEDMHWMTIHPTELTDENEIEKLIIEEQSIDDIIKELNSDILKGIK